MSNDQHELPEFGSMEKVWTPDTSVDGAAELARARAQAHATLVSTSMKVASIRAAAQSTLLDAHTQAEEVLAAARDEAAAIRENAIAEAEAARAEILAAARRNASDITDQALDERDLLLTATLSRMTDLTNGLMGIADKIVVHAEDPAAARDQMAQIMVTVADMVESDGRDLAIAA